ncbi:hypothetical protein SDRG_01309 [Saprolegnia diclina VS20]|uniref:Uncharacterized protein n=1 Tax=Saprolegnia diclina (strain VS20) TaxID=1156394 RepID=T0R4N8_SAPDV|nr:hypothetical protein SDRG_01309 [Saprolegnia diclina VS20]EQC41335.1 hypothetical protein SDRG_01309 [Saprolegnia diclina VS20]|eukprot:XP_008605049.1 hypothetical protein SDRG_01309 [Saprolegnia diclina VS20]
MLDWRGVKVATEHARYRRVRCQGIALSLLYLFFASLVAFCTYELSRIANTPVFMGLNFEAFTTNQFHVPINALLQASTAFPLSTKLKPNATLSLSDLLFKKCGLGDETCATAFVPRSNQIWQWVAKAFALIPNFDQPRFQDAAQTVVISHINNLSGWNKAMVQFSIPGHNVAMTCFIRRVRLFAPESPASSAVVDTLAFCSQRPFDPNWVCENEVGLDVATYAIQVSQGKIQYIGAVRRGDVYYRPGYAATCLGGPISPMQLEPVPINTEYEGGVVQVMAPWDIVGACNCATLNKATGRGWLLQQKGLMTMLWTCDSLLLQSALVLWCLTVYLVWLQFAFLRHSAICSAPVFLSKNVIGPVILLLTFYGNHSLQTLSTFMHQNPSYTYASYYQIIGPALVASIVGIMTGTLIQIWFNPRLVTQTWLLLVASVVNWLLVFCVEAFVVAPQSNAVPRTCQLATTINCLAYDALPRLHLLSPLLSGGVVLLAIGYIYRSSRQAAHKHTVQVPETNSILSYFNIQDFASVTTSIECCCDTDEAGAVAVDAGLLLIKSMLQVSDRHLTRTCNIPYTCVYRLLASTRLRRLWSQSVGSILVVHVGQGAILPRASYKLLDELAAEKVATGYLS